MAIVLGSSFTLQDSQLPSRAKELMMVWIDPGSFLMGSPDTERGRSESERQFRASFTQGFWLGQYPVTQALWSMLMGVDPSHFASEDGNAPVENISWHDAAAFCEELNRRYRAVLPKEYLFSLPTQAQWEYVCRAGTTTKYYSGDSFSDLSRVAWHAGNSNGRTHPVGEKEPNRWGCYDMHGNVWEWCHDGPTHYPHGEVIDWIGPEDGPSRVVRGGAWTSTPESGDCRSACRSYCDPSVTRGWFGFRLCLRRPSK
jgi:formylglycine-generating enzyme required for sulfatase activity